MLVEATIYPGRSLDDGLLVEDFAPVVQVQDLGDLVEIWTLHIPRL